LLPGVGRLDTGIVAVGGKRALDEGAAARIPAVLMSGPTPILGPNGCFMFVSAMRHGDLDADSTGGGGWDQREDYVMWGFSARRDRFGAVGAAEGLDGRSLKALVARLTTAWSPALRSLVEDSDPATVTAFPVRTSTPVAPWRTTNVTLLGDALHNMPPYRGVGANTALCDAALLRDAIVQAARGDRPLLEALQGYERRMIAHGFRAVRMSLAAMTRFHDENRISRTLTKAFLRIADHVPPVRDMMFAER
jgi:2-polyprenyl-6-methoxyphenol hydroxylase-like FAD-dependent oxidoreductase